MTVVMTTPHDYAPFCMETIHEAQVKSDNLTVGVTRCGLLFDLPEFIMRPVAALRGVGEAIHVLRAEGSLVTALEVDVPATCLFCLAQEAS